MFKQQFPAASIGANPRRGPEAPRGKRGAILLLAVLIMSTVVAASVGMSSLILNSLTQTRIIDAAIASYYAAETGIEDGMYAARRLDQTPASVSTAVFAGGGTSGAKWTRTVTDREDAIYMTLLRDSFVELALYDPVTGTGTANIGRIDVNMAPATPWTDHCGGSSVLVASVIGWDTSANAANIVQNSYTGGFASFSIPNPAALNRVRLRAQGCDIEGLQVRGYDASTSALTPLPGRIKIDSRGTYAGVEQRLTATLPRQTPLSGVYDFVIFSECSLVKGGTISCP